MWDFIKQYVLPAVVIASFIIFFVLIVGEVDNIRRYIANDEQVQEVVVQSDPDGVCEPLEVEGGRGRTHYWQCSFSDPSLPDMCLMGLDLAVGSLAFSCNWEAVNNNENTN